MTPNFAWFVTRSGPPNERWQFINSLHQLKEHMTCTGSDPDQMFFEFGPSRSASGNLLPIWSIPLPPVRALPSLFLLVDRWLEGRAAGPLAVFGLRNLFNPLLRHYGKSRGTKTLLAPDDILEALVLPGSIPTISDRMTCDRNLAQWLTAEPMLAPVDFWNYLIRDHDSV